MHRWNQPVNKTTQPIARRCVVVEAGLVKTAADDVCDIHASMVSPSSMVTPRSRTLSTGLIVWQPMCSGMMLIIASFWRVPSQMNSVLSAFNLSRFDDIHLAMSNNIWCGFVQALLRYRSKTAKMQKFPIDSHSNKNFISPFFRPPGAANPQKGRRHIRNQSTLACELWRESARGLSRNRWRTHIQTNKHTVNQIPRPSLYERMADNKIWRKTIFNMADVVLTPCNVAGDSEMTCHWIRPNVRHIGTLHLVSISTTSPQSTRHSAPVSEILSKSD